MSVSTGTPGGLPFACRVCGAEVAADPCEPLGDAVCPACGSLVVWMSDRSGGATGMDPMFLKTLAGSDPADLDSLDAVEWVQEIERLGIDLPDDEDARARALDHLIRFLRRFRDD